MQRAATDTRVESLSFTQVYVSGPYSLYYLVRSISLLSAVKNKYFEHSKLICPLMVA